MLPRNHPDRIRIVFDDHRLVANAGLLLPATLAGHLGLRELVDHHLDLGGAPGRANTGDKLMTLVASAMAGGDCIDDADVLRTGGTACTLGGTVKAPSTLGTFLRSFRWGHVRQLDRVSRELLARAWAAGAGPGDGPLTIDPPLPLSPVPLLHSHPFGGFGLKVRMGEASVSASLTSTSYLVLVEPEPPPPPLLWPVLWPARAGPAMIMEVRAIAAISSAHSATILRIRIDLRPLMSFLLLSSGAKSLK